MRQILTGGKSEVQRHHLTKSANCIPYAADIGENPKPTVKSGIKRICTFCRENVIFHQNSCAPTCPDDSI